MIKNKLTINYDLLICLFLALFILVIYWQVQNFAFIDYDDVSYITENHHVRASLTWSGIAWAFLDIHTGYWHPITWLSHMLDYRLYGMNAGGHHWTSVVLHIINALLLFLLLKRVTGMKWRSAFVAALFAVHPLNVESVVWVAERKNVLSTLFWILTLFGYVFYIQRPIWQRYLLVILCFTLGLMTKPMLVTLPFTLLLLDYWPLGRLQLSSLIFPDPTPNKPQMTTKGDKATLLFLIVEKIPLFILSLMASIITFIAARHEGAITSLEMLPFKMRIVNALVSYAKYIGKMIWPLDLAILYPLLSDMPPVAYVAGIGIALICMTILVIILIPRLPYLTTGWLWYLGTLVPVIGLIQTGGQAMADRYSYVTFIGLFIILTWGITDLVGKLLYYKTILAVSAGLLLINLIICSYIQTQYWKNSVSLFSHTLKVTTNNNMAHNNMGIALARRGNTEEAIIHYKEALNIQPNDLKSLVNMGNALDHQGRLDEAISYYKKVLSISPDHAHAHNNLGVTLIEQGKINEGILHFKKALEIKPDYADALNNLGAALGKQGKVNQAIINFKKALNIYPDDAITHNNMGIALISQGKSREALAHFVEAVRIRPDYSEARRNMGIIFMQTDKH